MDAAARSFELASAPALLLLSPSLPLCSRCCSLGSEEGVAGVAGDLVGADWWWLQAWQGAEEGGGGVSRGRGWLPWRLCTENREGGEEEEGKERAWRRGEEEEGRG